MTNTAVPLLLFAILMVPACGGESDGGGDGGGTPDTGTEDAGAECTTNDICDDALFCNGLETCHASGTCVDGSSPCEAGQTCDESTDTCDCGAAGDVDEDGHDSIACGGDDCDDADIDRFPGHPEVCDVTDHDEDCEVATSGECLAGETCRAGECASVTGLVAGAGHACALLSTGEVSCWGASDQGQTAQAVLVSSTPPGPVQLVSTLPLDDATMIASAPAANHTCAIRSGGTVVCWGDNASGQCGADAPLDASRAYAVPGLADVTSIGLGAEHSCAVLGSGGVRCWGNNGNGRLGSGSTTPATSATPLPVVEDEGGVGEIADAIAVIGGEHHTCVLQASGTKVSCAGREAVGGGWLGVLGRGAIPDADYPVADDVLLPIGTTVLSLHAGAGFYTSHTCALQMTGRPICWGANTYYQISTGGFGIQTPFEIDAYYSGPLAMSLGSDFTCVAYQHVAFGERVACQGTDGAGQLGDGAGGAASDGVPDDVVTAQDQSTFLSGVSLMASGSSFTCAKLSNGTIGCWGDNSRGQFGDDAPAMRDWCDTATPVPNVP